MEPVSLEKKQKFYQDSKKIIILNYNQNALLDIQSIFFEKYKY